MTDKDLELLLEAAEHLDEEGDFNRSWIDGRHGGPPDLLTVMYIEHRLQHAQQAEAWAVAIRAAHAELERKP